MQNRERNLAAVSSSSRAPRGARRLRFSSAALAALICVVSAAGCNHIATNSQNVEGVKLFRQGQYYPALERFRAAAEHDPGNADAYYNIAATLHALGKVNNDQNMLQQAEQTYHQCLDLSPNHADCHRALAVLLVDTNRQASAFTLLERWVARSPHVSDARVELARLYDEFGDRNLAERHLQEAIAADANNARAWSALASLRERSGQLSQALADYQRSYQLNGMQPAVAERIAALQQAVNAGTAPAAPSVGAPQYASPIQTIPRY